MGVHDPDKLRRRVVFTARFYWQNNATKTWLVLCYSNCMATSKANLHVPLPEDLHEKLREEARRSGRPATEIAREGIDLVLALRRREAISAEIAAYAREVAGSRNDLDDDLETATIEHLLESDERE